MKPSDTMTRIVDGVRYRVATATVLAHDEYWDGNNYERRGRNTWLYRSPTGRYFVVRLSQWQGERDSLEPLSIEEAKALYESLPEHEQPWESAFPGEPLEEA
jgi:hypothetical protein